MNDFEDTMIMELPDEMVRNISIGEHIHAAWHRRLAKAKHDYQYVAGQMKKQGIPLDLARVILFT
jgi:hypothetical protein